MKKFIVLFLISYLFSQDIEWRTFQHDNQRTGFTFSRGYFSNNLYKLWEFYTLAYTPPIIGDLEEDEHMEVIVRSYSWNQGYRINVINGRTGTLLWYFPLASSFDESGTPVIEDINNDNIKEIIVSQTSVSQGVWGKIYAIDPLTHNIIWIYEEDTLAFTGVAVDEMDGDGLKEVVFGVGKIISSDFYIPSIYILNARDGSIYNIIDSFFVYERKRIDGNAFPWGAYPVLGDLNNDGASDIVGVRLHSDTTYHLCAFDVKNSVILWEKDFSANRMVISDLDNDGINEVVILTLSPQRPGVICVKGDNGELLWEREFFHYGNEVVPMAVGDINNDSYKEIIVIEKYGNEDSILAVDKNGQILWKQFCESPSPDPITNEIYGAPHIVDIDNDNDMEILLEYLLHLQCFDGNTGEVTYLWFPFYDTSCFFYNLSSFGDLDNDGYLEIVSTVTSYLVSNSLCLIPQIIALNEELMIKERLILPRRKTKSDFIYNVSGQRFSKRELKFLPKGIYFAPDENKKYLIIRN